MPPRQNSMHEKNQSADSTATSVCGDTAEGLNRQCFCTTLDRSSLKAQLGVNLMGINEADTDLFATHPHLFSNTSVFISAEQYQAFQATVAAVTRVAQLPGYIEGTQRSCEFAPTPTAGVFMGYDFHLGADGPKVIEINTNAGGGYLNAILLGAQSECCQGTSVHSRQQIEQKILGMFLTEWQLQRKNQALSCVVIVDANPRQQYLYLEFVLAQQLFKRQGINAFIADPSELVLRDNQLWLQRENNYFAVDLIYNRLTDFALSQPANSHLKTAFSLNQVVVTPNPYHYALLADKRNLCRFSDADYLASIGAVQADIDWLQRVIPKTVEVRAQQADELWELRANWFFKPATGFGSKAAYRGDKLTKRVWSEILGADYVAQELIKPSERGVLVDGAETALKVDIRAYVYAGEILMLAARLYQGQTTNFRTPGGGFAPVFVV